MNALARVVESTVKFPEYSEPKLYQQEIDFLKEQQDKLFGIEREISHQLDTKILNVISLRERSLEVTQYNNEYLPIDMKCLEWRDFNRLPVLALFSLNNPHSGISVESERGMTKEFRIWPEIDRELQSKYQDVIQLLGKRSQELSRRKFLRNSRRVRSSISAQFQGMIPEATRKKILKAKGDFKQVYIMAEVKYKISDEFTPLPVRTPIDPLVLGYAGNGQLWLVDKFDTTSIEEAAFTVKS